MSPTTANECPICGNSAQFLPTHGADLSHIICSRCGEFKIDGGTEAHFIRNQEYSRNTRINISSWIFEHQGFEIKADDLEFLVNIKTPLLDEKANKLLSLLVNDNPIAGKLFSLEGNKLAALFHRRKANPEIYQQLITQLENKKNSSKYLAASWAFDYDEFCFILHDYLCEQLGYVNSVDLLSNRWMITPLGWGHIEELKTFNPQSKIAFVAMSFNPNMNTLFTQAIEPAIISAGYEPLRIDKHEHNNKIDDEIIASIRKSKFVVCDFTGQRGGVYFESGYTLGFGLRVIWTCRKDEIEQIHFDNRQYNFLLWEEGKLEDFKKALQNRIEATIGRPS